MISKNNVLTCDLLAVRLNANGSLDTSFGQNGQSDIRIAQGMVAARGVAVLPSGQIVVAGSNPTGYVGPQFLVARLASGGSLDTTFGPSGIGYNYTLTANTSSPSSVDSLGVDAAGNPLLGGSLYSSATGYYDQVVRYTSSGLIDTSFANQGILDFPFGFMRGVQGIGFQSTGQLLVAYNLNSATNTGGIVRLNPNGTIDTTFGNNGYFADPIGVSDVEIAVQPDDKIVFQTATLDASGNFEMLVDRVLPGGSLDPSFGTGGRVIMLDDSFSFAEGVVVGPDGKISAAAMISGSFVGACTERFLGDPVYSGYVTVTQQPPSSVAAGTAFGLTVDAEDSSGNVETSYNGPLTVALANNPGGATLGGTLTVTASQGVATFSGLSLTKAASGYTLLVSGSGLGSATTSAIDRDAAAAASGRDHAAAAVQRHRGERLRPPGRDRGLYGNVITSATNTVTVALGNNPGGATLGGTLTLTASQGVATFSGLTLTTAAGRLHAQRLQQRPERVHFERLHRDSRRGHATGDHPATAGQRRRERRLRSPGRRSRTPMGTS